MGQSRCNVLGGSLDHLHHRSYHHRYTVPPFPGYYWPQCCQGICRSGFFFSRSVWVQRSTESRTRTPERMKMAKPCSNMWGPLVETSQRCPALPSQGRRLTGELFDVVETDKQVPSKARTTSPLDAFTDWACVERNDKNHEENRTVRSVNMGVERRRPLRQKGHNPLIDTDFVTCGKLAQYRTHQTNRT